MTMAYSLAIQRWIYPGEYSVYNYTPPIEGAEITVNPDGPYSFAALDERGQLAGCFDFTFPEGTMVIGLGLSPELTGRGLGLDFVRSGIAFGLSYFDYQGQVVELSVAAFNRRAITVYQRAGFRETGRESKTGPEGEAEFVRMQLPLKLFRSDKWQQEYGSK